MNLVGFQARNHRQQTKARGPRPDVDDRATTLDVFNPLHERHRFSIDVAASAENTKLPRFYSIEDDGLAQDWTGERVWCNPPYSNIEPWIVKTWGSGAQLVVMLLPANRTEQGWWQRQVEPFRDRPGGVRVEFLPGRLRFLRSGETEVPPNSRPPFGCCLLTWTRESIRRAA